MDRRLINSIERREILKNENINAFERRVYDREVRVADQSEGEVKVVGYAAVFNKWSRDLGGFTEKIEHGFFDGITHNAETFALFNHNYDMPLAAIKNRSLSLIVDEIGLRYEFIAPKTNIGNDLVQNIRSGLVSESSFGFTVEDSEWSEGPNESGLWERTLLRGKKLYDVSPVTLAAYPDTAVAVSEMRHLNKSGSLQEELMEKEVLLKKRVERAKRLREAQLRIYKLQ